MANLDIHAKDVYVISLTQNVQPSCFDSADATTISSESFFTLWRYLLRKDTLQHHFSTHPKLCGLCNSSQYNAIVHTATATIQPRNRTCIPPFNHSLTTSMLCTSSEKQKRTPDGTMRYSTRLLTARNASSASSEPNMAKRLLPIVTPSRLR